jgi:hypothetical protein
MFVHPIGGAALAKDHRGPGTEYELGLIDIVSPTTHLEVGDGRWTAQSFGAQVVQLESSCLRAAMAIPPDERAPLSVAGPHLAPHLGGDVERIRARRGGLAEALGLGELLLLDVVDEQGERALKIAPTSPSGS